MFRLFLLYILSLFAFTSISASDIVKGADISWYTEMAADGQRFYNAYGEERECPVLMKELGFNAIRLRVWVNPEKYGVPFCDKQDVVTKAEAATALGMDVMIDFHYSDLWTDPSRQTLPIAWNGLKLSELKDKVTEHTMDVLSALKASGVTPRWVQIGNETDNGFLWDTGSCSNSNTHYGQLFKAGADAVRAVFPEAKVIVHLAKGYDTGAAKWNLDRLQAGGAQFDMIGISCYPENYHYWETDSYREVTFWSESRKQNVTLSSQEDYIAKTFEGVEFLAATFDVPVMICETGVPLWQLTTTAPEMMRSIVSQAEICADCDGVFYWEPETDGSWCPSSYISTMPGAPWDAYGQGAFQSGRPTSVLDAFGSSTGIQDVKCPHTESWSYDLSGRADIIQQSIRVTSEGKRIYKPAY